MGKIAFLFSGQGAQYPGMGSDLYNNVDVAKKLFDDFEKIKADNKELCFNGSTEELAQTKNTQPCLYTVDLAAALALVEEGIKPDAVAGFSLGELAALSFSGAMDYADGFKIVCKRGELMQSAGEEHDSCMVAVLKLSNEEVENICNKYKQFYPVNYNYAGQLVVSGSKDELEAFKEDIKTAGGRAMVLPVSGGFHSPFMATAQSQFEIYLKGIKFNKTNIPVYSNFTSEIYEDNVSELLVNQIANPVRWQKSMENMIASGIDTFIEVGVGKTLSGFMSKISKDVKVFNVENMESLKKTISEVNCD